MKPFSLLIKPAAADCNLACAYCFYLDKARLYPEHPVHRMSDVVLERLISTYMRTLQPQYVFGWQGGEPTLLGVEFFRQVTQLQARHAPPGATVANGLQTNGTLIDDEFAEHLARYQFLLGVSLDGPAVLHDRFRQYRGGQGSHAAALRGIDCLRRQRVEFNILVLVSQANVHQPREVYRYLRDQGFLYHQYIPCVEFAADGRPQPFAISGEEWGRFLCELHDEWRVADTRTVSIRHFDSLLNLLVSGERNVCTLGRNCCQYLLVEHNGDLYPCDFFVDPRFRLGNLENLSWEEALASPVYHEFGALKTQWHADCASCSCLEFCSGDCLKHRLTGPRPDPRTLSWLCPGWRRFLEHAMPGFRDLARGIQAERERQAVADSAARRAGSAALGLPRPGRNDPCPCGSGRKHKKCCGGAGRDSG